MAEAQGSSALFSQDGKLSAQELIPMALQHVVAAVVGIITPAIIVANLCHLPADQKTLLIQVSLVMSGLVTLVQAHPLFGGRFGSGLPVIMGTSFAYVPTLSAVGVQFGIGAILGAEIIGGAVAVVFALFFRKIKSLFPSVVTGTVVLCIGISLYTVAVGYMAGGSGSSTFGSAQNWLVALVTLVACVYFSNFGKGVFKLGSLLFGMLVGYVLALALGMVSYDAVVASNWFELPHFMPFAIKFVPASIASITIVFIVASLETIGNFTGATVGGMDREPNVQELTGGLVSQGIMTMVGAFFGAMPTSSFGQNVGIVTQTRVINRRVFSTAAIILVAAGLMPKLAAVLSGIPQAVIGGATINVFGTISMTGIRMLTKDGLTPRRASIAGLSVALGMGVPHERRPHRPRHARLGQPGLRRVRHRDRGHHGHHPQPRAAQGRSRPGCRRGRRGRVRDSERGRERAVPERRDRRPRGRARRRRGHPRRHRLRARRSGWREERQRLVAVASQTQARCSPGAVQTQAVRSRESVVAPPFHLAAAPAPAGPRPRVRPHPCKRGPAHHARGPLRKVRSVRYSWPAARFASSM